MASDSPGMAAMSDEDLARWLSNQEEEQYQHQQLAMIKADEALAQQLQCEINDLSSTIDQLQDSHAESSRTAAERMHGMKNPAGSSSCNPVVLDDSKSKPVIWDHDLSFDANDTPEKDLALALQLQMEEDQQQQQPQKTSQDQPLSIPSTNVTDELDPNPDLHSLFLAFNDMYFEGKLSACVVRWSSRMTLCAGTCRFQSSLVTITLSESLLKFRPRSDMIDTLLHEMIHALLFVTRKFDNRDGHGPEFLAYADRINKLAGTNITVYHTFHDEVKHHQTHVWRCDGPCRERAPYFGWVKRSMNRPPQKADRWFADHQQQCGGTYHKVSSPPKKESAKDKGSGVDKKYGKGRRLIDDDSSSTKISDFFGSSKKPRKDGR